MCIDRRQGPCQRPAQHGSEQVSKQGFKPRRTAEPGGWVGHGRLDPPKSASSVSQPI